MKYFLRANSKQELIDDLKSAGFVFYEYDEYGHASEKDPEKGDTSYIRGFGTALYLEHLVETPAVYEGEELIEPATYTQTFHANVLLREEFTFATDMGQPTTPQHDWA
jgi:alpha-beta hydrolase superfamily lysophospholipase